MVCFDHPLPEPLAAAYPLTAPLGIGLALSPAPTAHSKARLDLDWDTQGNESGTPPSAQALAPLWSGNPAGHGLPLLEMIARAQSQEIRLPGSPDATLRVQVRWLSRRSLDRAGIAAIIPHRGAMVLLDRIDDWGPDFILGSCDSHRDPGSAAPRRPAAGVAKHRDRRPATRHGAVR
jgi:hypothetical protein